MFDHFKFREGSVVVKKRDGAVAKAPWEGLSERSVEQSLEGAYLNVLALHRNIHLTRSKSHTSSLSRLRCANDANCAFQLREWRDRPLQCD